MNFLSFILSVFDQRNKRLFYLLFSLIKHFLSQNLILLCQILLAYFFIRYYVFRQTISSLHFCLCWAVCYTETYTKQFPAPLTRHNIRPLISACNDGKYAKIQSLILASTFYIIFRTPASVNNIPRTKLKPGAVS